MSVAWAWGSTALPDNRVASRNSTSRKALPPKMSLTASWSSPWWTDCRPVEISGNDVAAARTVAPNSTPDRPTSPAMASPARSSDAACQGDQGGYGEHGGRAGGGDVAAGRAAFGLCLAVALRLGPGVWGLRGTGAGPPLG